MFGMAGGKHWDCSQSAVSCHPTCSSTSSSVLGEWCWTYADVEGSSQASLGDCSLSIGVWTSSSVFGDWSWTYADVVGTEQTKKLWKDRLKMIKFF